MNETTLTIGRLAQPFGLNTSAIRHYERVGVMPVQLASREVRAPHAPELASPAPLPTGRR